MRASSTVVSLMVHAVIAIALLYGFTEGHSRPPGRIIAVDVFPPADEGSTAEPRLDPGVPLPRDWDNPGIPLPRLDPIPLGGAAPGGRVLADSLSLGRRWHAGEGPVDVALTDEHPALLSARPPVYPELLRQAGLEGRVVLEAVVDTAGRVEPGSIVVLGGHPGLAAAAAQSLAAALFRPARVQGRPVRVRVRIPFEFTLAGRR